MKIEDKTTAESRGASSSEQIDEFAGLLGRWKARRQEPDLTRMRAEGPADEWSAAGEIAADWIRSASTKSLSIARAIERLEHELTEKRRELSKAKRLERALAIEAAAQVMRQFGITLQELGGHDTKTLNSGLPTLPCAKQPREPRYFGAAGEVWSGFGRRPAWLKRLLADGHRLADLQQDAFHGEGAPASSK